MQSEFIPYEQALELKELGFNEPCFGYYYTLNGKDWKFAEKSEYYRLDDEINIGGKFSLLAPTFSQAFRWFRENHGICTWIERLYTDDHVPYYRYSCEKSIESPPNYNRTWVTLKKHTTYEEAELACLIKLIEVIKERNGK